MYNNQRLECYRPCRVSQPIGESSEDFGHASLARLRRKEDVLDIFGLRRGKLQARRSADLDCFREAGLWRLRTLIFVPPLTDFSNELAIGKYQEELGYGSSENLRNAVGIGILALFHNRPARACD